MGRMLLLCLVFLAGCLNVAGPFAPKPRTDIDDPRLSIPEKEARARQRWAIPDPSGTPGIVDPHFVPYR